MSKQTFIKRRRMGVRPSHFFSLIGSKIRKILNIARPGNYFLKKWFFKKEAKEGMFISIIWGSVVHLSLKPYQRYNIITQNQLSVISKNPIIVCSTQSECNNKHLDSFKVVNLGFWYFLRSFRTRHHVLTRATMPVTIYVTVLLWKFCIILNRGFFNTWPEMLLNALTNVLSQISKVTINFLKKIVVCFFYKNLMITYVYALKVI